MRKFMKTRLLPLLIALTLFFSALGGRPAHAAAPTVSAKSAILIDMRGGQVLWEKNAYEPLPPASTTKILTAITAIEN
ncbi:MAG: D-alanyl-D-alanine carboxypeptidase, partial [Clostridiales bacterium]|nr:D-alanyl-D-alanine carboxypeptidase [Clostridiales bacterium]